MKIDNEILNRNKNQARGFRNLDIWQLAMELYCFVYTTLEKNNRIVLKVRAQVEDSSFSVHSNIAEGYNRSSVKDTHKYYVIAQSSSAENYSQILGLYLTNQISRDDFDVYDNKSFELQNKLIQMNKNLKLKIPDNEWNSEF